MTDSAMFWVCSENSRIRGKFIQEKGVVGGITTVGYVDTPYDGRIYVRDDRTAAKMVELRNEYTMIEASEVQDLGREWRMITIRSFTALDRLDSAGEMACGFY